MYYISVVLLNSQSNGFSDLFLDIISFIAVLCGIYVISSKNPIVSVLFLIGLFLSISVNLILLGYNFLGLSYLLVYVGAVSILFLFILMLINVRISELLNDTSNSIPLALFTGFSLGFPLYKVINQKLWNTSNYDNYIVNKHVINNISNKHINSEFEFSNKDLGNNLKDIKESNFKNNIEYSNLDEESLHYALSNTWDNNLIEFTDISSVGNNLYTTYGIWLIISSIILLLAMVGAIIITKKDY